MVLEEPSKVLDGWRGYSTRYLDIHLPKEEVDEEFKKGDTLAVKLDRVEDGLNLAKRPKLTS